jgi:Tol biopolymer transport system component
MTCRQFCGRLVRFWCGLAPLAIVGCSRQIATARDPVPVRPILFEPGVVSTALPEFAITIAPDGREMYFDRASADRSSLTIMMTEKTAGGWSAPRVAPFSGSYRDVDPFISPDGRRLYFSSDRPRAASRVRSLSTWYVERTSGGWSAPIDPGEPLNSDSLNVFVSLSRGGTLLLSSRRDGHMRVYASRLEGTRWIVPAPVSFGSVAEGVSNAVISPSGRFVVLVLDVPNRGSDLFVSCRIGSGWSEPKPLADGVNSRYADFAPAIDPGETTLYFTSERPGIVAALPDSVRPPGDIYRISLAAAGVICS